MPAKTTKAPAHLAPETAAWWLHVHADFDLEMHHTRLLALACEAFDRCGHGPGFIADNALADALGLPALLWLPDMAGLVEALEKEGM